jgi:PPOX class probable F420-dependent enzyme
VEPETARSLLAGCRLVRLATVRPDGAPHLVPICFALAGDTLYTAVDHKPKRSRALQRLANIAGEPRVSVLADAWDEDWSRLWWVRADGRARLAEPGSDEHARAGALLRERYAQYRDAPPFGTAVVVAIERLTGWYA